MSSDPRADAAIGAAARIAVLCRSWGMTIDETRDLFAESAAFADGKHRSPSDAAMFLYEGIRSGSSGSGESLAEFIRMIASALSMIDVKPIDKGAAS